MEVKGKCWVCGSIVREEKKIYAVKGDLFGPGGEFSTGSVVIKIISCIKCGVVYNKMPPDLPET